MGKKSDKKQANVSRLASGVTQKTTVASATITRRKRAFAFNSTATKPTHTSLVPSKDVKPTPVAPQVFYTPEVYLQIQYIVSKAPKEIGWLGLVDELADGDYLIHKIYIPKQTVTSAETDIDSDAMADLALEILEADLDPGQMFYWGHSHVNMAVSPSAQDEDQIDQFLESCPKFIRGIYNKRGESKVDVYLRDSQTVFQCVTDTLYMPAEDKAELDKVLKANVKERSYAVVSRPLGKANGISQPVNNAPYYINGDDSLGYHGQDEWPDFYTYPYC